MAIQRRYLKLTPTMKYIRTVLAYAEWSLREFRDGVHKKKYLKKQSVGS
jgi:hypothetical protein